MELTTLLNIGMVAVISIIGWFLKELYSDFKEVKKEVAYTKTKTKLIEQKSISDISELTKLTEMHITTLNSTVEKQANNIERLTQQIIKLTAKIGTSL